MAVRLICDLKAAVFVLILCLLAISCTSSSRDQKVPCVNVSASKDVVLPLSGHKVISRLFISEDNKLIVVTQQEPFVSVIDVEKEEMLVSFGRLGRANNELRSIPQGVNYRKGKLQYYDSSIRSLVSISVPECVIETLPIPVTSSLRPMRVIEMDKTLVVTGGLANGRVVCINPSQEVAQVAEYPFDTSPLSGINRGSTLQCDLVCPPDLPKFLIRTIASDCFELYENTGDEFARFFVNEFNNPPVIERIRVDYSKSCAGYIRSFSDNTHIYLMYSEESYRDSSSQGLTSDVIHVYDWEGHFVQKISLPEKIGAFCINDTHLFGVVDYLDHSEIIRYKL